MTFHSVDTLDDVMHHIFPDKAPKPAAAASKPQPSKAPKPAAKEAPRKPGLPPPPGKPTRRAGRP